MSKQEKEKFEAKLEWIKAYKSQIREWRSILNLLESLKFEVKTNGLSRSTRENFEKASVALNIETPRMKKVHEQIMSYIKDECDGFDGVFLGSSDIIESVFGKYKNFSAKSSMKEIGRTILTIPAFTSKNNLFESGCGNELGVSARRHRLVKQKHWNYFTDKKKESV